MGRVGQMRDKEKDAAQMAIKRQRMLEAGFELFSQRGIAAVPMSQVATASGCGIATLYRYFPTKIAFVIAVGAWVWDRYLQEDEAAHRADAADSMTAGQMFEEYLDRFVGLYRSHKDLLRFNQFFNSYLQGEDPSSEQIAPYLQVIERPRAEFGAIYRKAEQDGTLRTDVGEEEMFSSILHIMLAVATRYAVGLVYTPQQWAGAEAELLLVRRMLVREYVVG